jgi:NAD(P)-dependent dehydrogenase (short-subunit alcohol dehydrogenase family)|eukprot:COSAG06_NODE_6963_length_2695_cov_1.823960_2_plen_128_part_00
MFDTFHGKVALVTGGSIGIGRMIAEGLAVNGCKVYITSRKEDACLATAAELNEIAAGTGGEVIGFGSDLSVVEGCESAVEYISKHEDKLHILINNAGATVRARDARTARSDPPFALGGASPDRTHSR